MKLLYSLVAFLFIMLLLVGCSGTDEGTVGVSIEIKNADDIGAVGFNLIYDPSVLSVGDVLRDELATGADSGYNADTPGNLLVVVQNARPINGDGVLVKVFFNLLDESGSSSITLENVVAKNRTTLENVNAGTVPGSFNALDMSVVAPVIDFSILQ